MVKKSRHTSRQEGEKYRSIFEHSAVSLWEEDISRLRGRLDELSSLGVTNLRGYLETHPEFLQEAVGLIEVTDVNQATLRLYEAETKGQLLGPLSFTLDAMSRIAIMNTILAIKEGKQDIEAEYTTTTLTGKPLALIVKSHIPEPGAAYTRMLVSLIDITARKEAEERARQSAIILHSIVDSSPDWIFVKDNSLRMVLCNAAVAHAIGKEPEDTYGKSDIENGWSVDVVKGNAEKGIVGWEKDDLAALSGKTVQVTAEPSDFHHGIRYFDTAKFPLRDNDGTIIGLVGIGRDITERRKAEADVQRAKEFAENLINTANVMVLGLDPEGHVTIFNKAAEETTGYTRAEIVNLNLFETVVPKEWYSEVRREFERLAREGETGNFENPILTRSGDERVISWQNSQILEHGRVTGTLSFGIDITERKKLEAKNQLLAALVDSSGDAIVGMDLDRRITAWNRGAERLYGYSVEEITGAAISVLMPPELEGESRILGDRLRRGEVISHFETIRLRKDGSKVNISLTLSPIRDGEGRIVGTAAVGGDITEQKAFQAQLNRAQRLESLATLAGGVAHRFNNINAVVKSYLDLMQSETKLPGRLASYVKAAQAGVQRAVDITDRLLTLTEPGVSSNTLRLDILARPLLDLYAKRIEEEKVRLVLDLAETAPVKGDERRLTFVLSSLIGNALDSLLDRPVRMLSVRTGRTKETSFFEVEDSGCGIPEEDLPRLFSPFFSAKGEWAPTGSPQTRLKGVGLDLAISSATVSEHGGTIDVKSTRGAGSTFKVLLPLAGVGSVQAG